MVTGNLNVIPDARVRNIIYINDFSNRWCKREYVEPDALKEWKSNILKICDTHISVYSRNTHLLPPKPKSSCRQRGIQELHMNYIFTKLISHYKKDWL